MIDNDGSIRLRVHVHVCVIVWLVTTAVNNCSISAMSCILALALV